MVAAKQRLLDMGCTTRSLETDSAAEKPVEEQEQDEDQPMFVRALSPQDALKIAPWNLTENFIDCVLGRCLLTLTGIADPVGNAEGYAFQRLANKSVTKSKNKKQAEPVPRAPARMSEGRMSDRDRDLRKLSLEEARQLLVKRYGYDRKYVDGISRWQVIHLVR